MKTSYRDLPRPLLFFIGGKLLSLLGDGIFMLAIPWLIYDLTGSVLAIGLNYAIFYTPYWLLPLMGVIIDRVDHKKWLIASNVGRAVILFGLYILVLNGSVRVWHLYTSAFVIALFDRTEGVALEVIAPRLLKPELFAHYNALLQNIDNTSWYIGPFLGGVIISLTDPQMALLVDGITYLVITTTIFGLSLRPGKSQMGRVRWRDVLTGFKFLWKKRVLMQLAVLLLFWNATWGGTYALLIFYFRDNLSLSAFEIGAIGAAGGLMSIVQGFLSPWLLNRFHPRWLVLNGIALSGLAMALVPFSTGILTAALLVAIMEGPFVILTVIMATARQIMAPMKILGRVSAASGMITALATPIVPIISGALAEQWDVTTVMVMFGLVTVIGAVIAHVTGLSHINIPQTAENPA